MAIKYKFVRIPIDVYNDYKAIQGKMQEDLRVFSGKEFKLPLTRVFKAIVSPQFNENFIQIDLSKLIKMGVKLR